MVNNIFQKRISKNKKKSLTLNELTYMMQVYEPRQEEIKMKTWFTSDLHFGHANIVGWRNSAGSNFSSVEQMNELIIRNFNDTVASDDQVIFMGDLVMGLIADSLPLLGQLNGVKKSVIGNHDRVFIGEGKKRNKPEKIAMWQDRYKEEAGVEFIEDQWFFDSNGNKLFFMSHFPTSGDHTAEERFTSFRPNIDENDWLVHGHVHNGWKVNGKQINVGVDVWDFKPVSLEQILEIIKGE